MLLSELQKKALHSDALKEYADENAQYHKSFLVTPEDENGFVSVEEVEEYLKLASTK